MNKNRTNEIDGLTRPAGFENETDFLSSRYGYKTVAEHRTNSIAL